MYLDGFDKETLTLHGRPIKLDDAMRRTNHNLKRLGLPQVAPLPAMARVTRIDRACIVNRRSLSRQAFRAGPASTAAT